MAIHEQDLFDTSTDQPAWPHPCDGSAFTVGCPDCDTTRTFLLIQLELRLAVRDLWIHGWTPTELVDEIRRRTDSTDARDLIIRALVDDDSERSEQARTEEWTQAVAFLAAISGVEEVAPGWVARWSLQCVDPTTASKVVFDVLDELQEMLLERA